MQVGFRTIPLGPSTTQTGLPFDGSSEMLIAQTPRAMLIRGVET